MFFEQAETDIATRLSTVLGIGVQVEVCPETQADFKRPFEKNRIEVIYKKSSHEGPSLPHTIVQNEVMEFELVFISRLRRGDKGIFKLIDDAYKAIIGYSPSNCQQLYSKTIDFEKYESNLWYYIATVACKTVLVENNQDETGPLLTALGFQELE